MPVERVYNVDIILTDREQYHEVRSLRAADQKGAVGGHNKVSLWSTQQLQGQENRSLLALRKQVDV